MGGLIAAIIIITNLTLFAQAETIPTAVQATLEKMYPSAEEVNWDQDGEEFLAGFEEGDYYLEVTIQETGVWVQTLLDVFLEDLPTSAQQLITQKYEVEEYYNMSKVMTPEEVRFYANFETKTQSVSLTFDEHGKLIGTEEEDL